MTDSSQRVNGKKERISSRNCIVRKEKVNKNKLNKKIVDYKLNFYIRVSLKQEMRTKASRMKLIKKAKNEIHLILLLV